MADHNLGTLSTLPGEIRALIWKEFQPGPRKWDTKFTCHEIRPIQTRQTLGVLRACRQLYEEVTPYIYDNEVIDIWIGSDAECLYWMLICTARGGRWEVQDIHDPLSKQLSNLPFWKLRTLKITIEAPNGAEGILCLSTHVRDLVKLLAKVDGLPNLEFYLRDRRRMGDTPEKRWVSNGRPSRTSIDGENGIPTDSVRIDYLTALLPFCQLRNMPSVKFYVAKALDQVAWKNLKNISEVMMRKTPFGQGKDDDNHSSWNDAFLREHIDHHWKYVECILDQYPGPLANKLRLRRLMNWFNEEGESPYAQEFEKLRALPECYKNSDRQCFDDLNVHQRYKAMMCLNPLSADFLKMRFQAQFPRQQRSENPRIRYQWDLKGILAYFKKVDDSREELPVKVIRRAAEANSYWSRKAWIDYYPDGIPPHYFNKDMMEIQAELWASRGDPSEEDSEDEDECIPWEMMRDGKKTLNFSDGEEARLVANGEWKASMTLFEAYWVREIKKDQKKWLKIDGEEFFFGKEEEI